LSLLLEAAQITKAFAGVQALRSVSFDLVAAEVHAVVGENGAGKSTLIKIISGAEVADSGTLTIGSVTAGRLDPHTARTLGIATIYQQPALFPDLTVAENIALALESGHAWRRIDWTRRRQRARDLIARLGASLDPDRLAETLSMPEQQLVEIAKALGADAKILIMDEPTASLSDREVTRLFDIIDLLRRQGAGIIYISHRLEEVFEIADRITVLRDGQSVATLRIDRNANSTSTVAAAESPPRVLRKGDENELIRLMVGRELAAVFPKRPVRPGEVVLELRGLSNREAGVRDVSLTLRQGEILGLAGLVGSGRTELAETLFGLRPASGGTIEIRGAPVHVDSPARAIAAGIGYVPEDRRRHGVVTELSIAANTTLASLVAVSRSGFIDRSRENESAAKYVRDFRIRTPSVAAEVGSLSGGNQQKVALARWLSTTPSILVLDEPTQGVDVGAKAEIHGLMQNLVEQGLSILMISSELPEILGMSDRIAVMRGGTIAGTLARDEATPDRIMTLALGHASGSAAGHP
jgi:rhamnose transport system ATP-binding protein